MGKVKWTLEADESEWRDNGRMIFLQLDTTEFIMKLAQKTSRNELGFCFLSAKTLF